jgi:hypothetical protein
VFVNWERSVMLMYTYKGLVLVGYFKFLFQYSMKVVDKY